MDKAHADRTNENDGEKSKNIVKGAIALTIGLVLAKIFGALYKIPLASILAEDGMGVYQAIFPIYAFLIVISSGAVPTAISIIISGKIAGGRSGDIGNVLCAALWLLIPFGLVLSVGLMLCATWIGEIQGVGESYYGYIVIAPAVVAVTVVAVFKGYFQGLNNMKPTAVSEVSEAAVKLGVGLGAAFALRKNGLGASVAGALAGITASEVITILVMVVILKKNKSKISLPIWNGEVPKELKQIIKIAVPISLSGVLFSLSQVLDSFLIVNILSKEVSVSKATEYYGIYSGYVATLINMPVSLGLTFGVASLPAISGARAKRDALGAKIKFETAFKYSFAAVLPFAIIYFAFSQEILNVLYPKLQEHLIYDTIRLLQIGAANIVFLTVLQLFTSVMQGVGYMGYPVGTMVLYVAVKVGLTILLLPRLGILGSGISSLVACSVSMVLNAVKICRLFGVSHNFIKNGSLILLASGIIGLSALVLSLATDVSVTVFIISAPIMLLLYATAVLAFGVFSEEELIGLPFGKHVAKIASKISIRGMKNDKFRKT